MGSIPTWGYNIFQSKDIAFRLNCCRSRWVQELLLVVYEGNCCVEMSISR